MKRSYLFLLAICLAGVFTFAQNPPSGTITYQTFYDELSPYGTWINYPGYGEVWHPEVSSNFKPYGTNGYWENTDQGWYWDSEYSWGWAPFHYGRWFYDDGYGWLWEPGYEWSPAWVTWGDIDNYYAWAPLAPEGLLEGNLVPHNYYWNLVNRKEIYNRNLGNHLIRDKRLREESGKITGRGSQPNTFEVGQHSSQSIPTHTITAVNAPVIDKGRKISGNSISVYQPEIKHSSGVNLPARSRRLEEERANPMRSDHDWPTADHTVQHQNIEQLPIHQSTIVRMGKPSTNRGIGGRR